MIKYSQYYFTKFFIMKNILYILLIPLLLFNINDLNSEPYDRILVILNDEIITLNEFKESFIKLKLDYLKIGRPLPKNSKQTVFENLLSDKIIKQIADKNEIFVSDVEVDDQIERIRTAYRLSDAAFKQELERVGTSLKAVKEENRKQILREKIVSLEIRPRITLPTDEEMKAYYESNPDDMYSPPTVKVSHIFIRDNPNVSLSERSKLKQKAKDDLQKALSGKNFEKLAQEFSADKVSAPIGGDIGYITKGEWLGPQVDALIFDLKKGEIAAQLLPGRGGMGWHIVKVTDKKSRKKVPFEDIRMRIENYLVREKMENEFEQWVKEQKRNAYFEVIFPGDEKYIYDFDKWKKKNGKKIISNDEFLKKIEAINI